MEIRTITTFVRAAELRSFSKAAEQMGYSQAAVTVQIQQLEQELGVRLFDRVGRNVRLTEEGNRFLQSSLEILKTIDTAKRNVQNPGQPMGSLRVGVADSLLMSVLPPVIADFQEQCPQVELSFKTGVISELFDMIRQNDADVILFLDQKVHFPDWVKVFEHRTPIVFVASADHPLAGEKKISMERILQEPLFLTERNISYRYDLEQLLAQRSLALHPCLETGSTTLIAQMLQRRAGISFLPEYVVADPVREGKLAILDVDCPKTEMWVQFVYHKNKWVTPQMECFAKLVQALFEENPMP